MSFESYLEQEGYGFNKVARSRIQRLAEWQVSVLQVLQCTAHT